MTASDNSALVRLEERVAYLIASAEKREKALERVIEKVDAIEAKLDQGAGGVKVLRWLGFGSLASALAACGAVYVWLKGMH